MVVMQSDDPCKVCGGNVLKNVKHTCLPLFVIKVLDHEYNPDDEYRVYGYDADAAILKWIEEDDKFNGFSVALGSPLKVKVRKEYEKEWTVYDVIGEFEPVYYTGIDTNADDSEGAETFERS